MGRFSELVVLALAGIAAARPSEVRTLHEKRSSSVHSAWVRNERVRGDSIIPVRIGLTQNNLAEGEERLRAMSDPTSKDFGRHMSMDEVHDLFAPSAEAVQAVMDWLLDSGISSKDFTHSQNKGWIAAEIPASDAERLFSSTLYEYEHSRTGDIRIGSDEYHLPTHLVEHIDFVTPGVKFSARLKKRSSLKRSEIAKPFHPFVPLTHQDFTFPGFNPNPSLPADLQHCDVNITIPCIRALYHIPKGSHNIPGNDAGVFEQGSYYSASDLDEYWATFDPEVPQGTRPHLNSVDGGEAPTNPAIDGGEANLDLELVIGLTYPQGVQLYQVDDQVYEPEEVAVVNTFNTFLDALDGSYCNYTAYGITGDSPGIDPTYPDPAPGGYKGQLECGVYKPTRVITASYGESEQDLPKNYVLRQCNEFMKLGLQGHTIMVSSSDYGVGGAGGDPTPSGCLSGEGQNQTIYNPDYPSGCPWITTVGATQLNNGKTVYDPETSLQTPLGPGPLEYFASSGGFSNYFPTAWYQQAAVDSYFFFHNPGHPSYAVNANASNIGQNGGLYNRNGRGYPDIAANGAKLPIFVNGVLGHYYGTSLASPIWASVITLINGERSLIGKGPVGFINPTLYASPWALNDITNGSNPNCGSSGFTAVQGWDPVTGLGTPNYPLLLDVFLALP